MAPTGAHRVTIDSTTENLWTPTALDGVVNTDNDWTASDQSSHENLQKLSRQLMRLPLGAIENLVEGAEGFALGVIIRRQDDTVLLPGVSSTPVTRTSAFFQVRVVKAVRNGSSRSMRKCGTASPDSVERSTCFMLTSYPGNLNPA